MDGITYDVRVYKTEVYRGARRSTYYVRWRAGTHWRRPFANAAQAEGFRGDLMIAARKGHAFDLATGEPVSWGRRARQDVTWYALACQFVDLKWRDVSPRYRQDIARALTAATPAMYEGDRGKPDDAKLRRAMTYWAFNSKQRADAPEDDARALRWLAANTKPIASLVRESGLPRTLLDAATSTLDGRRAAADTVRKHRMIISSVLDYATELTLLKDNPIKNLKVTVPIAGFEVDTRSVVNHQQAKRLLQAVELRKPSGPRLVAFFASMYYSALRPEEAINLRSNNVELPTEDDEWGELRLYKAASHVGGAWTDSGEARIERNLKQRPDGHERRVPIPPALVVILRRHMIDFAEGPDGRLFYGYYGGDLALSTYRRAWAAARKAALTASEVTSPLAARPYDLRHACVSTWLSAGVPATQVAAWAGHSVDVLLRIYAKCVAGQDEAARRRIAEALRD